MLRKICLFLIVAMFCTSLTLGVDSAKTAWAQMLPTGPEVYPDPTQAGVWHIRPVGDPEQVLPHPLGILFPYHPAWPSVKCTEDVWNVQWVLLYPLLPIPIPVDKVILHSTDLGGNEKAFEFGAPHPFLPSCVTPRDCTITGEEAGDPMTGDNMTRIENGGISFRIIGATQPNIVIRKIHFHNASYRSIDAMQANDVNIVENRITADTMQGRTFTVSYPGRPSYEAMALGITVIPSPATGHHITGNIVIEDNYINLELDPDNDLMERWPFDGKPDEYFDYLNPDPDVKAAWEAWDRWCTFGMRISGLTVPSISVRNNVVKNTTNMGIYVPGNSANLCVIENNTIVPGLSCYHWGMTTGNIGINAGTYREDSVSGSSYGALHVKNNNVICDMDKDQDAIWFTNYNAGWVADALIENNNITLTEGKYGIRLVDIHNGRIRNNIISGDAKIGLMVGDPTVLRYPLGTNSNLFTIYESQIENLAVTEAHVYCEEETYDNVFRFFNVRRGGIKITDRGTDNDIEFEKE